SRRLNASYKDRTSSAASRDIALLTQPDGFEGLLARRVLAAPHDLAAADGVDDCESQLRLDTAPLGPAAEALHRDDAVSRVDQFLRLEAQVVEVIEPVPRIRPHRVQAPHRTDIIGRALDRSPVDVRSQDVP